MKSPVLLIHGLKTRSILTGQSEDLQNSPYPINWLENKNRTFEDLPKWLASDGFDVYLATYNSGYNSVPAILDIVKVVREQIRNLAKKYPKEKITIIAHSLGGLVVRAYIDGRGYKDDCKLLNRDFIERVVMIGTPNNGSPFGRFLHYFLNYENNPHLRGLKNLYNRKFMRKFNKKYTHKATSIPYFVIAGNVCNNLYGKLLQTYVSLRWGDNDGACPVRSAFDIESLAGKAIVPFAHENILGLSYYESADHKPNQLYLDYLRPLLLKNDSSNFQKKPEVGKNFHWWLYPLIGILFSIASIVAIARYASLKIVGFETKGN